MISIDHIRQDIRELLEKNLSPTLTYHNTGHTLSVVASSIEIARQEHIHDENFMLLLEAAAWFHDTGFIKIYNNHEKESCRIATEKLPAFGANPSETESICDLIMGTRIPQSPPNILGAILCDADLSYLGTDDFYGLSENLKLEWLHLGFVSDDLAFQQRQISFLENHRYFTSTARLSREPVKHAHLVQLQGRYGKQLTT